MVNEGCLNNEDFLAKVPEFFNNDDELVVHLTTKRLVVRDPVDGNAEFDSAKQPQFDVSKKAQSLKVAESSSEMYPVLIRMRYGKRKCSTTVTADALDKFWQDYSSVVKSSMKGLVKKKKKKTKGSGVKSKRQRK
ncbi:hypothetical protein HG536_0A02930 [Torulaspora globosa]|uniref:Signal recognition particle subunit SRP14 n=1 Tax=Torulaspora globosa TaxID=48254 RepID=A0A7G3ZAE0_9SACH|nr:uncharacterized protein HG536_0A02930 [Torulaspora globosa]QLL30476.1 hypothetical protein HG536_0A02930 [Torulaspora globosa]